MQVVLLQIFLWILRIILLLLILMIALIAIVMIVPVRYRMEGHLHEKKPTVRGRVTWFFYLFNMKFKYDEKFHMVIRVFGIKVYDSLGERNPENQKEIDKDSGVIENMADSMVQITNSEEDLNDTIKEFKSVEKTDTVTLEKYNGTSEYNTSPKEVNEYTLEDFEKEVEVLEKEEAELADKTIRKQKKSEKAFERKKFCQTSDNTIPKGKNKKTFEEIQEDFKIKIKDIFNKIKDILKKIQNRKLKADHYIELWNRRETQVTFQRAKKKLGKVLKALSPKSWKIEGNIGFLDPATTGKVMGAIGSLYPILGNKVSIIPDFENEIFKLDGNAKGHIRLGNLIYQVISLLLNRQCFKFIKLVFDERDGSKKKKEI